jgi:hypothetical protein
MTSNTYTLAEIRAARRAAMELHRKSLIRAEADRIERGWSKDDDFADIWRVLGIVSALILALVIGLGIYSFAASSEKIVEASDIRARIEACKAEGRTAQVSRDANGVVLAVECGP